MKSSFKKLDKSSISQKSYFGHPDLDAIFSNSLTKGHLMILQQDHPTTNYLSLLRYFISSNYNAGIPCLIYDSNPGRWRHLVSPVRKDGDKEKGEKGVKSEIAWRYDSMEIKLNQLVISDEVKYLDLTKKVDNVREDLVICKEYPNGSLQDFYRQIEQDYLNCQQDQKDTRPKKLLLSSLPSSIYKHPQIHLFLQTLRCLTRSSHLTTLITLPPIISEQTRNKFLLYSDFYLQIGKIGKGYTDFCAALTVVKEVQSGQVKMRNRGATVWGIRNKRREFRIQGLYQEAVQEGLADQGKSAKESVQF